jgi:hypothetical protein
MSAAAQNILRAFLTIGGLSVLAIAGVWELIKRRRR